MGNGGEMQRAHSEKNAVSEFATCGLALKWDNRSAKPQAANTNYDGLIPVSGDAAGGAAFAKGCAIAAALAFFESRLIWSTTPFE